jgi:threonine dehydrogenase-like Zn-dependent dehydrogenase
MIQRHVDLIAIGSLLLALAFCLQIRRVAVVELNSPHRIAFIRHSGGSYVVIPPAPPRFHCPFRTIS